MDQGVVKEKLISVLQQIQTISGEDCPQIEGDVRPVESLPKFNSKVWPVAAGMLSVALGKKIPPEKNLFVDDATKHSLTISQTVALVCKIINDQEQSQETDGRHTSR